MKKVGEILKKKLTFLVKTPRRRFADKVGTLFGVVIFFLYLLSFLCLSFTEGGFVCLFGMYPAFFLFLLEFNNIFLIWGISVVSYYLIGYILGLIFFLGKNHIDKLFPKQTNPASHF